MSVKAWNSAGERRPRESISSQSVAPSSTGCRSAFHQQGQGKNRCSVYSEIVTSYNLLEVKGDFERNNFWNVADWLFGEQGVKISSQL
jgi:hypothetical protein